MKKDTISLRNAICLGMLIIISNGAVLMGDSSVVEQDIWIAMLMSLVILVPLVILYGRMIRLMPGRDIYEMAEITLGKAGAKTISIVFGLYCLYLGAVVLGTYAEFIHLTSLYHTPFVIIVMVIFMGVLYLAKSGIETLGKWSVIIFVLEILSVVAMVCCSMPMMDLENLLPIMEHPMGMIADSSWKLSAQIFGELVVLLALVSGFRKRSGSYKLMLYSLLLSVAFVLILSLRNCAMLGAKTMSTVFFPNYMATSLVEIGTFLERIESLLSFTYILGSTTKIVACIIAASRGMAKLFSLPTYHPVVLPVGFLTAGLATIFFRNTVEILDFMKVYPYLAIPFQLLIPLLIWVTAEVKNKRNTLPAPSESEETPTEQSAPPSGAQPNPAG